MEEALNVLCYVFSTLLGLAVGSFLNVCIYRIPIGKFWSNSRSFCPKCGAPIKAYDNIPLLSYIILRGKCRACHEPISMRYPTIEALNMVLWIVNYAVFGMNYITIIYDILVSTLIVVAMIDYDTTEIPDSSIIALIIMGLLTFIPAFGMQWQSKLIGAFCVSVPMFILAYFGLMGMGDAKLFFGLGLLFGWEKILIVFIISFVLGTVIALINLAVIKHRENHALAGENLNDNGVAKPTLDVENNEEISTHSTCMESGASDSMLGTPLANESADAVVSDVVEEDNNLSNAVEETKDTKHHKVALNMDASDEEFEAELDERLASGKAMAFGPSIVIAAIIAMYFGDMIIDFYMKMMGF